MERASKQENPNVPPVSEPFLLLHCVVLSTKKLLPLQLSGHFYCWADPGFNRPWGNTGRDMDSRGKGNRQWAVDRLQWNRTNKRTVVCTSTSLPIKYQQ